MFAAPEVRVGPPLSHGRLTVFPLFAPQPQPVPYRLADDALADGTATVEEVTEGGSVPQLAVENRGDALVLFLEGQELRAFHQAGFLGSEYGPFLLPYPNQAAEAINGQVCRYGAQLRVPTPFNELLTRLISWRERHHAPTSPEGAGDQAGTDRSSST